MFAVIGSSHGFDPISNTTGFILWMNQVYIIDSFFFLYNNNIINKYYCTFFNNSIFIYYFQFGWLVDPPPNTIEFFRLNGISTKCIRGIILTHCHADHDAGKVSSILYI